MVGLVSTVLNVVVLKTVGLLAGKAGEATTRGCSATELVELFASVRVSSEKGFY